MSSEDKDRAVQTTGADWLLPAAATAFAAYYLYSIRDLPWDAQMSGFFIAGVLLVFLVMFAAKTVIGLARRRLRLDFTALYDSPPMFLTRLVIIGFICAFIFLIDDLGFTLATFLFLLSSFLVLKALSPLRALLAAFLFSLGGFLLFVVALGAHLPRGPVENAVRALAPGLF